MTERRVSRLDETQAGVLRRLGYSSLALDDFRHGMMSDERARVLEWMTGMVSPRGVDWGHEVRNCGKLYPVLLPDGSVRIMPMTCKTRGCPRCMRARARQLADDLRSAVQERQACEVLGADGSREYFDRRLVFVTMTQVKRDARVEDAGGAISRILKSWRRMISPQSRRRNEDLRAMVFGGVRSLECVWSPRNKLNKDGGRVKYSGWHAHAHCIFELHHMPTFGRSWMEDFADELRDVWRWASKDSNPETGVDVQPLDLRKVGQLSKYLTKPFELDKPKRARELFRAASGRRILNGFGGWESWRRWVPKEASEYAGAKFSAISLGRLADNKARYDDQGRGALLAPSVAFCEWHHCPEREATVRRVASTLEVADVWAALGKSARDTNIAAENRRTERELRAGLVVEDDSVSKHLHLRSCSSPTATSADT